MRAGQLRHRVDLQHLGARVGDGAGGGAADYETYAERVPAAIEPLTGRELFDSGQFIPANPVRVRIRYRSDVRPSHRIKYGERRLFDIQSVADLEEKHCELELMCQELVTW